MATVEVPSPGFFAAVLHAIRSTDPREDTLSGAWAKFIDWLSNRMAQQLPAAISGILPLLRNDLDRLRFTAETLVRFDMFEAAEALTSLAIDIGDGDILLSAASLCGHPGVSPSLKKRVSELHSDDRWIQIRIYDHTTPSNEDERLLYEQCWPGARSADSPPYLPPVVILDTSLEPKISLDLTVRLVNAGSVVRRIGIDHPIPQWFGPHTVLICRPPLHARIASKCPKFLGRQVIVNPKLENERDYALLLKQTNAILPSKARLRAATPETTVHSNLWDPDVYRLGVYKTGEAAFLTSAPRNSLYRLAKQGLLRPRHTDTITWTFSDLVAVRTWRYLRTQSMKPIKPDIVSSLAKFAGNSEAVKIGVTSSGDILADQGNGWEDIKTKDRPLDIPITDIDDVFRPFDLGRYHTPHLLHANETTQLHPAILHGAPHLKGHRIPALNLAQLDYRGGQPAIFGAYPELKEVSIYDTISIGHQLMNSDKYEVSR